MPSGMLFVFSPNSGGTLSYSLPVLMLYPTPTALSQFVSEDITHYPVPFQSANGVPYHHSLFRVIMIVIFLFLRQALFSLLSVWHG
jgi:hypothetical protein